MEPAESRQAFQSGGYRSLRTTTSTAIPVSTSINHELYNKDECIMWLRYGFTAVKYGKKGSPHYRRFYLLEQND
jgi:hypothetical protein